jgi:hypothetical protein
MRYPVAPLTALQLIVTAAPDDTPIDTSADGAEYARLPPDLSSATTLK